MALFFYINTMKISEQWISVVFDPIDSQHMDKNSSSKISLQKIESHASLR